MLFSKSLRSCERLQNLVRHNNCQRNVVEFPCYSAMTYILYHLDIKHFCFANIRNTFIELNDLNMMIWLYLKLSLLCLSFFFLYLTLEEILIYFPMKAFDVKLCTI